MEQSASRSRRWHHDDSRALPPDRRRDQRLGDRWRASGGSRSDTGSTKRAVAQAAAQRFRTAQGESGLPVPAGADSATRCGRARGRWRRPLRLRPTEPSSAGQVAGPRVERLEVLGIDRRPIDLELPVSDRSAKSLSRCWPRTRRRRHREGPSASNAGSRPTADLARDLPADPAARSHVARRRRRVPCWPGRRRGPSRRAPLPCRADRYRESA